MGILGMADAVLGVLGRKTTSRYASAEYGLPPGALYARELAAYTDAELMARDRDDILAEVRGTCVTTVTIRHRH